MAYPQGPYQRHSTLPVESRPVLGPARKIDFVTRRYVLDDNGSIEAMSPTAQRVVILVMLNVPVPKFNTIQARNEIGQGIRNILSPLQIESPPAIELLNVTVEKDGPSGMKRTIKFRDLSDQRHPVTTVQLP